jgi:hypothetical protein
MWDSLVTLWVVCAGVAILGWIWRINMALNHPEKYERLRKVEEDRREDFRRACKPFAPAAKKAGSVGVGLLMRMLTKRR